MSVVFNEAKPVELVEKYAEQFANELGSGDDTTKSQLRRFYQEYLSLRRKIKYGGPNAYMKNEVALKLLIAKAAYAGGRPDIVPPNFVEWIKKNIGAINNANDVETFGDYFEAVIGYFYAKKKKRSGQKSLPTSSPKAVIGYFYAKKKKQEEGSNKR